jgi:GTPase SAR1 family protein
VIVIAYGLPGTGKSTLLHDLVRVQASTQRFFVVDYDASWGPDAFHWRGKAPEPMFVFYKGDGQWEAMCKEGVPESGVFVFRSYDAQDVASFVKMLGNATYVDDEIDKTARRMGWLESPLRAIVHEGRHLVNARGDICTAHIMGACRRPQNIHTDITDIADQIYVFRVQGNRTLGRLLADNTIEPEQWETVRNLPKFNFWYWPGCEYLAVEPLLENGKDAEGHIR